MRRLQPVAVMSWTDQAACRDVSEDVFFPPKNEAGKADKVLEAKSVCRRCPVILECRAHAFSYPETVGIWGGLLPIERGFRSYLAYRTTFTPAHVAWLIEGGDLDEW